MAKPVVDGLERELVGRARVVRLSVGSGVGRELAQQLGVRGVPTVIVFDGQGAPVLRLVGRIDRQQVLSAVSNP